MHDPVFQPLAPGDPLLIGGYRVLARLEDGGRGSVYLAVTDSGRRLAIWVVRPDVVREHGFEVRFRRDMAAVQRVGGSRVVAVVDYHAGAPRPWIASEYVPGPSLAQVVAGSGPLPPRSLRILMGGIAEALRDMHAVDVVHGRLVPSTVLLAQEGPRVTGYGVAPAGSPDADVLALGGVVFYAATGRQFEGTGLEECPPDLRPLIERCLAEVPADRPSPEQVLTALEQEPGAADPGWLTPEIVDRLLAYTADPEPPLDGEPGGRESYGRGSHDGEPDGREAHDQEPHDRGPQGPVPASQPPDTRPEPPLILPPDPPAVPAGAPLRSGPPTGPVPLPPGPGPRSGPVPSGPVPPGPGAPPVPARPAGLPPAQWAALAAGGGVFVLLALVFMLTFVF
ncbi:protein kinase domain-containing protein [Actinomadura hibisca]|uniref:protein kinase domain-containing protein n=1 Tax=Actinomadura hibisca TaxID=68565 RepID=UPI0008303C65|nr:phosphotransferase [Actinomadura hibisca]